MDDKLMLMIPGPTPVPEKALLALAKHPIGHRSGDFSQIMAEVTENLKWLHQTQNDVLILTGSGTAAMEAGIINFLKRGDRVLCGCNGKFGDRWAEISKAYGLNVEVISAEWGEPLDPEQFRQRLEADAEKEIKAVILTHSETSTGVLNDLETIKKVYEEVKITYEVGEPETIEKDGMLMVVQSETSHVEMSDELLQTIIATTEEIRNKHMNIKAEAV